MKTISILGSTGSIGTQALQVADALGDIRIAALTAGRNVTMLEQQARKYRPRLVAVMEESACRDLRVRLADTGVRVLCGMEGLEAAATADEADMVLTSVVGSVGLLPTLAAIRAKKHIALANKETLVTAGELVMPLARACGVDIVPVDSEHGAIFQCLQGEDRGAVQRILLTASGGPFYGKTAEELQAVTVSDALAHPNWAMGNKITIDSATLMNKGLEVIEAHHLFDVAYDDIQVVVHRQSIVHSAVEFVDGSVVAQMGAPDMRLPISYAFCWPQRRKSVANSLDIFSCGALTFAQPDMETFRCLPLAFRAGRTGGTAPAVMNGANEAAVALFLDGKLPFTAIADLCEGAVEAHKPKPVTVETVLEADREGRAYVRRQIQ